MLKLRYGSICFVGCYLYSTVHPIPYASLPPKVRHEDYAKLLLVCNTVDGWPTKGLSCRTVWQNLFILRPNLYDYSYLEKPCIKCHLTPGLSARCATAVHKAIQSWCLFVGIWLCLQVKASRGNVRRRLPMGRGHVTWSDVTWCVTPSNHGPRHNPARATRLIYIPMYVNVISEFRSFRPRLRFTPNFDAKRSRFKIRL
jgi:hypothetical protein